MVEITLEKPNEDDESITKKFKTENDNEAVKEEIDIKPSEVKPERCVICRQYSNELVLYNGHPNNSADEYVALTDDKLMLFTGEESEIHQNDERPTHKVIFWIVFCDFACLNWLISNWRVRCMKNVLLGVPQGSVFGYLLFLTYLTSFGCFSFHFFFFFVDFMM